MPFCDIHEVPFKPQEILFSKVADCAHYTLTVKALYSVFSLLWYRRDDTYSILKAPVLCDVTAIPANIGPLVLNETLDPAIGVHVTPSLDRYAV